MTQTNKYISLHDWHAELDADLTDESDDEEDDEEEDPPEQVRPPASATQARYPPTRPSTRRATERRRAGANGDESRSTRMTFDKPVQTSYPATFFFELLVDGYIDLDPEYQRGIVWTDEKQSNLIDSLCNNYFVPPLVFAITKSNSTGGAERRTCIDGKQRLTSILRFMKGEIPLKDSITHKKLWWSKRDGDRRKVVSKDWQTDFKQKAIVCVDYKGLTPEQERGIFQRVQLGVPLTPNESLAAANGPLADCIRDLKKWINGFPGFEFYMEWDEDSTKARVFQMLAQVVYVIDNSGPGKKRLEPNPRRLKAWLDSKDQSPDLAKTRNAARLTMGIYCRIVAHPVYGIPITNSSHGGLSTIEFVGICLLIFKNKESLSDCQLSHAIDLLRCDARTRGKKTSLATFKHVSDFVYKRVPSATKLKTDGNDFVASRVPLLQNTGEPNHFASSARAKLSQKRKRVEVEESESDDDVPLVTLKTKKAAPPKRRKPSEEDEESNDGVIALAPPSKPKSAARAKKPLSTAAISPTTSGKTTVKRSTTKPVSSAAPKPKTTTKPLPTPASSFSSTTQTARPTVRPGKQSTTYTPAGSTASSPHSSITPLPADNSSTQSVSAPARFSKPLPTRKSVKPVSSASVGGNDKPSSSRPVQAPVAGPSTSDSHRLASVREANAAAAAAASNLASTSKSGGEWKDPALPLQSAQRPTVQGSQLPPYMVPGAPKPHLPNFKKYTAPVPVDDDDGLGKIEAGLVRRVSQDQLPSPRVEEGGNSLNNSLFRPHKQTPVSGSPHLGGSTPGVGVKRVVSEPSRRLPQLDVLAVYNSSSNRSLPSATVSSSSTGRPSSTNSSPSLGGVVTPSFTTPPVRTTWGGATPGRRPSPPSFLPTGSISGRQQERSQHPAQVDTPSFTTPPIRTSWGGATPGRRPSPPSFLPSGSISGRQQERSQHPAPFAGQKRSRSPDATNSTREARRFVDQHQGGTTVAKDPRINRPSNSW